MGRTDRCVHLKTTVGGSGSPTAITCHVADIDDDVLIGMDWLSAHAAVVDCTEHVLRYKDDAYEWVSARSYLPGDGSSAPIRVKATRTHTLVSVRVMRHLFASHPE
ncbi:hypothetical protein GQ54DRAFT_314931 [Martensiomyces pterosporus]|nr:hypothetical protein GQ54DRAFT_314931 [Martensiomyces pterosporus]